ncbi:3868_t:CDS:2, partial [Ambispora gerdemannii]
MFMLKMMPNPDFLLLAGAMFIQTLFLYIVTRYNSENTEKRFNANFTTIKLRIKEAHIRNSRSKTYLNFRRPFRDESTTHISEILPDDGESYRMAFYRKRNILYSLCVRDVANGLIIALKISP